MNILKIPAFKKLQKHYRPLHPKIKIHVLTSNLMVLINIFYALPQVQFSFDFGISLAWNDFTIRNNKEAKYPPPTDGLFIPRFISLEVKLQVKIKQV